MGDRGPAPGGGWARPVQAGATVSTVIVSVILLWLVSSQGRRVGTLERSAKANRQELERLADRPEPADIGSDVVQLRDSLGKLRAGIGRLDGKLTAIEGRLPPEGLAESVAEIRKAVRELTDEIGEVRRMAEAPAETPPEAEPAAAGASAADLAALSGRVAKLERAAADLEALARGLSDAGGKVRINEDALRDMVKKLVQEEVEKSLEELRNRFRPQRRR